MIGTCQNCDHSKLTEDLRVRMCRRFPPVASFIPTPQGVQQVTAWPAVSPSDGCGEFRLRLAIDLTQLMPNGETVQLVGGKAGDA